MRRNSTSRAIAFADRPTRRDPVQTERAQRSRCRRWRRPYSADQRRARFRRKRRSDAHV